MEPNPEIPGLFDLALVNFPSADVSNLVAGLKGRGIVISNWADPYDNDGSVGLDITAVPRLEELVGDIPVPNGMVEHWRIWSVCSLILLGVTRPGSTCGFRDPRRTTYTPSHLRPVTRPR